MSEDKGVRTTLFFLGNLLEVAIDDGDGKHDTCAAANGAQEVGKDAEGANAETTEGGGGEDVLANVLDHGLLAVAVTNDHVLFHQLGDDVARRGAADVDPDAREESTTEHDEQTVNHCVEGITSQVEVVTWWRDVVGKTTNRSRVAMQIILLPFAEEANEVVARELAVEDLREEVEVGHKGRLQDDWDVGGVEELDWVRSGVASHLARLESDLNAEAL